MTSKARLGLYLEDEDMKRQIKVAAAKHGMTITDYCAQAIEDRLVRDGERLPGQRRSKTGKGALLARMDRLRKEIGPVGMRTSELVDLGRRR